MKLLFTFLFSLLSSDASALLCEGFVFESSTEAAGLQTLTRTSPPIQFLRPKVPHIPEDPSLKYLDTRFMRGVPDGLFVRLEEGQLITPDSAFSCTYCGSKVPKITEVPTTHKISCPSCPASMTLNQKQNMPPITIRMENEVDFFVFRPNVITDPVVLEFFNTRAVGCSSCGNINIDPGKNCATCGSNSPQSINKIIAPHIEISTLRRNPTLLYKELLKMGYLDAFEALREGYLTRTELNEAAQAQIKERKITLEIAIKRGWIDPYTAVGDKFVAKRKLQMSVLSLLEQGFLSIEQAIESGWIKSDFAIKKELITKAEADKLLEPPEYNPSANALATTQGRTSPNGTGLQASSTRLKPASLRRNPSEPFTYRNIRGRYKFIAGVGTAAIIAGAILSFPGLAQKSPPLAEVQAKAEYLVIFESQERMNQLVPDGERVDVKALALVPGVKVVDRNIQSQLEGVTLSQPGRAAFEKTEKVGLLNSVVVLNVNGKIVMHYESGPLSEAFPGINIGDRFLIEGKGLFNHRLGTPKK